MPGIQQWLATWAQLSLAQSAPQTDLYREVMSRYRAPRRCYHNEQHLDECFACFRQVRAEAQHPAEIEMAIWFHDAVYDSSRQDNEERSANWALCETTRFGVSREPAERIHSLILATRHDAAPIAPDARILVDVDLAILAAEPGRFDEYEKQVRQEYSWVPGFVFRRKRRELLTRLLERPTIYSTGLFRATFEPRARDNLRRSLEAL